MERVKRKIISYISKDLVYISYFDRDVVINFAECAFYGILFFF
jgi:hypothetical protein